MRGTDILNIGRLYFKANAKESPETVGAYVRSVEHCLSEAEARDTERLNFLIDNAITLGKLTDGKYRLTYADGNTLSKDFDDPREAIDSAINIRLGELIAESQGI